jgi:hypothetical protein
MLPDTLSKSNVGSVLLISMKAGGVVRARDNPHDLAFGIVSHFCIAFLVLFWAHLPPSEGVELGCCEHCFLSWYVSARS